jgi:hypothetical protein
MLKSTNYSFVKFESKDENYETRDQNSAAAIGNRKNF